MLAERDHPAAHLALAIFLTWAVLGTIWKFFAGKTRPLSGRARSKNPEQFPDA